MDTKLIYLEQMGLDTCDACVVDILTEDGKTIVVLDQTIFYPQGGGQPSDTGVIQAGSKVFNVTEVRFVNGKVNHIGNFETEAFDLGESVTCRIDLVKRNSHSQIHSAGHLIDMALKRLGIKWEPGKGYHFLNGPYVEYSGSLDGVETEGLKKNLEDSCNEIISNDVPTKILFMKKEDMSTVCEFVPEYIPKNKPGRVVLYGDFGIPCGGTHVLNLNQIGKITIRKIKKEGKKIRVSYGVEPKLT